MENKYYAQIQNGKVVAISELAADMVPIETNDPRLLGTTYNGLELTRVPAASFMGLSIYATVDKTEIAADGVDAAILTLTVKTWDGQDSNYSGKVGLTIGGNRLTLDLVNGTVSHSITSATPGILNIQTSGSAFTTQATAKIEAV